MAIDERCENVKTICDEMGYVFYGFIPTKNGKNRDLVKLKCIEHQYYWETTRYETFIKNNICCKVCVGRYINEFTALKKINNSPEGYEYLGYVDSEWAGTKTKFKLYCPKHNHEWLTTYNRFIIHGCGCVLCGNEKISNKKTNTTNEFMKKAIMIHGNKYDYSKTQYITTYDKVCIICPLHGEFWQTPNTHLQNNGCSKCNKNVSQKEKTNMFIEKAIKVHNNKYDYSKVEYNHSYSNICIICSIHGEFWQLPKVHLRSKGCPKCYGRGLNTEEWINRFTNVHGNKYDYSKFNYIKNHYKSIIICKKCNREFLQTPSAHLQGKGCKKCAYEKNAHVKSLTQDEWINRVKNIHDNKYNYSQVKYTKLKNKVLLKCNKCNRKFKQFAGCHLRGHGCGCDSTSKMEEQVYNNLKNKHILFIPQHTFEWLKYKRNLHLDFYLPEYNIAIECQGIQHFKPIDYWGGEKRLKKTIQRDKIKKRLCEENGVKLYYINYNDNVEERLNEILTNIRSENFEI